MTSVLIVLSGARVWTMKDGTPHPTGFWAVEFTTAHQKFTAAGLEVHIATPGGVTPTVDPLSLSLGYNNNDQSNVDAQLAYMEASGGQGETRTVPISESVVGSRFPSNGSWLNHRPDSLAKGELRGQF